VYSITKSIDLDTYSGCLSSIFTIESTNLVENINMKEGAAMRFKRVSNFTTLDSQVAFIIEKIYQGLKHQEIITELIQKYDDMNDETANDVFSKTIKDLELVRGANKRRSIMVKINPGFKTNMILNPITSELKVVVSGINDISYLDTLPIYIDSFIRITQDMNSTKVDMNEINDLCSGPEIEDLNFDEIVAKSEENINENEVPDIKNDSPVYFSESSGEISDNNDLLDILGFAEEEDNTSFGGGNSSESEPSVDSNVVVQTASESESEPSVDSNIVVQNGSESESEPSVDSNVVVQTASESESEPSVDSNEKPDIVFNNKDTGITEVKAKNSELEIIPNPKPIPISENKAAAKIPLPSKKITQEPNKIENKVHDITGMKLKYPNLFS